MANPVNRYRVIDARALGTRQAIHSQHPGTARPPGEDFARPRQRKHGACGRDRPYVTEARNSVRPSGT